ncbi:hypothetical protein D3C77_639430 [compost metagenome]
MILLKKRGEITHFASLLYFAKNTLLLNIVYTLIHALKNPLLDRVVQIRPLSYIDTVSRPAIRHIKHFTTVAIMNLEILIIRGNKSPLLAS